MGRRGPAPKPTHLKLVDGTRKDRVNLDEPKPEPGPVAPPGFLNEEALAVWQTVAPDLEAKKVLTPWDVDSFARYCAAVARVHEAERQLNDGDEVIVAPIIRNGKEVGERLEVNPWVKVWKTASDEANRLAARFGLTPSDRAQIKVGDVHRKNEGQDLLS